MKNSARIESLNFDEQESVVWRKWLLKKFFQDLGIWFKHTRANQVYRWILVVVMGLFIGVLGFAINQASSALALTKFAVFTTGLKISNTTAYFNLIGLSLLFATISGLMCYLVPEAAGGGIPEVKAYLNGINLRSFLRFKVLMAKFVGVIFSVASGLPIGKEGPLIHIGAIAGTDLPIR